MATSKRRSEQRIGQRETNYEPLISRYDEMMFEPEISKLGYLAALARVAQWLMLGYTAYPSMQSLLPRRNAVGTCARRLGQYIIKPTTTIPTVYIVICICFLSVAGITWIWRLLSYSLLGMAARILLVPLTGMLPAIQDILRFFVLKIR